MERITGPPGVRCVYPTYCGFPAHTQQALARDGFRCMVTGLFDRTSMEKSPALKQLCVDLGATYTAVHARHILSESTMQGVDPAGDSEKAATVNKVCSIGVSCSLLPPSIPLVQTEHAVTAMAVLSHFGLENLVSDLLAKDGVHDTGNLLSLEPNIHIRFDRLNLWFEGTEEVCHSWLSSGTSLMHPSPTVTKSAFLILLARYTFVGVITGACVTMATTYMSRSLQTTRKHDFLTQSSSLFMQRVLGSHICPALPRPATSWSAMSKKQESLPLTGHLPVCSTTSCPPL